MISYTKQYKKDYYLKNREKWRTYYQTRKSLPNHLSDGAAAALRHYYKNRDKIIGTRNEYLKQYAAKNADKVKAGRKRYYLANKKKHQETGRLWKLKNPEKAKAMYERYANAHRAQARHRKHKRRAEQRMATVGDSRLITQMTGQWLSSKETRCFYCDTPLYGKKMHIDHIEPLSRGGAHAIENLCAACPSCNLSKKDKTFEEWMFWRFQNVMKGPK